MLLLSNVEVRSPASGMLVLFARTATRSTDLAFASTGRLASNTVLECGQGQGRCVEERAHFLSKDGMDQAKWSLPRSRHGLVGMDMAKFQKPRLKLHAVFVHGVALHLFLVDPRVQSDSAMIVDCAARALEHSMQKLTQMGRPKPTQLCAFVTWLELCSFFAACVG